MEVQLLGPLRVSNGSGEVRLAGAKDEILILDVATLQTVASLPAEPYDNPLGLAWLDGGATLAYGGIGGRLAFRSIPGGEELTAAREVSPGWILDLATNADASKLATLGTDGDIFLWDPGTRQVVGEPLVPPGSDLAHGWIWLGTDGSGEFLEVQYETGQAVRYPIDTQTLIARACAIVGREPTTAQWQAMHGQSPQRPTCGSLAEADQLAISSWAGQR